jgi:hypothetical protein
MSHRLVSRSPDRRSPDLRRLRDDGFDIDIVSNYLRVSHVPYVDASGQVAFGMVVSELTTNGEATIAPTDHTVYFVGGTPHDTEGSPLSKIINKPEPTTLATDLIADCMLSSKPLTGSYPDYYAKITAYVDMVSGWAQAIDPAATARTFPPISTSEGESVFSYHDSASSRAHIGAATEKLALKSVAIVGLGGTGSYILDLVAKTPVTAIHLYDADRFHAHNAFRAPGAASIEQIREAPFKVDYYACTYGMMHRGIVAHRQAVDENNIVEMLARDFVFLALDVGSDKRYIVDQLVRQGVPFIDCGIGVYRVGDALAGIVRTTTGTPSKHDHIHGMQRIPFADEEDEYDTNIQIACLNSLNAALAVMKWKKLCGFYVDFEYEHFSAYTIDGNHLLNADEAS